MGFNDPRDYGEEQTDPDRSYLDIATDTARAGAQGLTFGFADEIEAAITAGISGSESYGEALARVRGNIKKFQQDNPSVAFGAEITGAIIPSIVAQLVPVGGQAASAANAARIAATIARNRRNGRSRKWHIWRRHSRGWCRGTLDGSVKGRSNRRNCKSCGAKSCASDNSGRTRLDPQGRATDARSGCA